MNTIVGLLLAVGLGSFLLTGMIRRYALWRSVLDVPNARSSHTVPTPRGGGVAIVCMYLLALAVLWRAGEMDGRFFIGLSGAGLLVAVIGFVDDHRHIPARWRLAGHLAAAVWALLWLDGLPVTVLGGIAVGASWVLLPIAVLYLAWLLNLYNFMDGIDGIAGIEAIVVCLAMCVIYAVGGHADAGIEPLLLAVAVAGFLVWNFPPARIFMGDAGSGFLGITLGVLSIQGAWLDPAYFWAWIILLGVFIVDATVTLLRRLFNGEKVYEAHRSHAYQYAARDAGRHLPVTLAVAVITVCWLAPVALCVTVFRLDGLLGTLIAYCPLIALSLKYRAGQPEA